jgi:hypothetical protein
MTLLLRRHSGQALVESVIGLTYVIIPLLLLLPFMAKITGVQHRAEQAAHYSAWERTVWKESQPSDIPNRSGLYVAKKNKTEMAKQIPWRFYQKEGIKLDSNNLDWDWGSNVHPLLKHQVKVNQAQTTLLKSNQNTVKNSDALDRLTSQQNSGDVPGTMGRAIGQAVGLLSFTGFSLERDQFYRTQVNTNVDNLSMEPFDSLDLNFTGNSALLASGWNAAGPYHVKDRVSNLVLTNYMDTSVIRTAQQLLSILPFGEELHPSSLQLGLVETDILPLNRLCTYGTENCGG